MMHDNPLTPALSDLMKACQKFKTTESKVLAIHLNKSPATVRTEFQRAMALMNVNSRYAALKTAEENGWLEVTSKQH
ncbi:DNA-binding response regulator [Methylophilus sp. QUAN]|uniref:DNA-binding response regulator n=1 Tax=Methylophilus sp. QUAN TaxID=2781020 RepID=UPI001E44AB0B|nr:DNA-binding response regulator [Methylophilus sp. QUAN]